MPWPSVNQRRGVPRGHPTASLSLLVQVGEMPGCPGASVCGVAASGIGCSARLRRLDAEDRRRVHLWIEANTLARALPAMLGAAQELGDAEKIDRAGPKSRQRQLDRCLMDGEGIEVDGDEDAVGAVLTDLAVEEHVIILRQVEA